MKLSDNEKERHVCDLKRQESLVRDLEIANGLHKRAVGEEEEEEEKDRKVTRKMAVNVAEMHCTVKQLETEKRQLVKIVVNSAWLGIIVLTLFMIEVCSSWIHHPPAAVYVGSTLAVYSSILSVVVFSWCLKGLFLELACRMSLFTIYASGMLAGVCFIVMLFKNLGLLNGAFVIELGMGHKSAGT